MEHNIHSTKRILSTQYLVLATFCLLLLFNALRLNAQTTSADLPARDVPRTISYQGQLTSSEGIPMNGTHQITATLYADWGGTTPVWQGATPVIKGSRSVDNTCIAWGNVTGALVSSFGVKSVTVHGGGWFTIILNYVYSDTDPNGTGGSQVNTIKGSAITATTLYIAGVSQACTGVQVTPITFNGTNYTFDVHTWDNTCTYHDEPFMFHVFARP